MTIKVGINGFGRIGRSIFRALHQNAGNGIECVLINAGIGDVKSYHHLLKYDSVHGKFESVLKDDKIVTEKGSCPTLFHVEQSEIPWSEYEVDYVIECTGKFTNHQEAAKHISGSVKGVLVSAPCDNADATIVYGVNDEVLNKEHRVVSVGSCTTNCLAPIAKVLNDSLGIVSGFMTTVHSYTNDQNLVDAIHKDVRRARAAAMSMIPSSTGAAKALGLVIPELTGKLDGSAIRVPTPNVSLVDLKVLVSKNTSVQEVNSLISDSRASLKGVLEYTAEELVSIDFNGNPHSSIFDSTQTKVVGGNFVRVCGWYDNEWGFSNRVLDVLKAMNKVHD